MTVYAIRPGAVSCALVENLHTGQRTLFVYCADRAIVGDDKLPWTRTPRELQEALRKHFDVVYSLPADRRQEYLDDCDDIVVETPTA